MPYVILAIIAAAVVLVVIRRVKQLKAGNNCGCETCESCAECSVRQTPLRAKKAKP